jgi:hypothetical protein
MRDAVGAVDVEDVEDVVDVEGAAPEECRP